MTSVCNGLRTCQNYIKWAFPLFHHLLPPWLSGSYRHTCLSMHGQFPIRFRTKGKLGYQPRNLDLITWAVKRLWKFLSWRIINSEHTLDHRFFKQGWFCLPSLQGHLVMSGDIFGCQTGGCWCSWDLVGRKQQDVKYLGMHRIGPPCHKESSGQISLVPKLRNSTLEPYFRENIS